jgi:hypothetical protein
MNLNTISFLPWQMMKSCIAVHIVQFEKHGPFKENNADEKPFADCFVF